MSGCRMGRNNIELRQYRIVKCYIMRTCNGILRSFHHHLLQGQRTVFR